MYVKLLCTLMTNWDRNLPVPSSSRGDTSLIICECTKWQSLLGIQVNIRMDYAMNITKKKKKNMSTANILIMSQRFDVMDWKYLTISVWAASTFSSASWTFTSILKRTKINISTWWDIKQSTSYTDNFTLCPCNCTFITLYHVNTFSVK